MTLAARKIGLKYMSVTSVEMILVYVRALKVLISMELSRAQLRERWEDMHLQFR